MLVLKIPKEQKQTVIHNIQSYFDDELSQTIGELAAENLLDFMLKQLGPTIYNQAIRDARAVVMQQMERVDEEIYALEQSVDLRYRD